VYQVKAASRRVEKEIAALPHQMRDRVLYDINDDQGLVIVLAVLHRREAYR